MKTLKFRMPKFSTEFGADVTLFVGNLPEDMDTEWLSQLFSISGYVMSATEDPIFTMKDSVLSSLRVKRKDSTLSKL